MDALRHPVARHHRLDIDKHPARHQCREKLVPAFFAEHPVRHRKDQPIETGEPFERNQLDAVFALGLGRVGERIVHQGGDAVGPDAKPVAGGLGSAPASACPHCRIGHLVLIGRLTPRNPMGP